MLDTSILGQWILEALTELNGSGRLIDVVKTVWKKHQSEIETSGDSFFTWQYDIRWAATMLRKQKKLIAGVWELQR